MKTYITFNLMTQLKDISEIRKIALLIIVGSEPTTNIFICIFMATYILQKQIVPILQLLV